VRNLTEQKISEAKAARPDGLAVFVCPDTRTRVESFGDYKSHAIEN
jgi:hypothetical protein